MHLLLLSRAVRRQSGVVETELREEFEMVKDLLNATKSAAVSLRKENDDHKVTRGDGCG